MITDYIFNDKPGRRFHLHGVPYSTDNLGNASPALGRVTLAELDAYINADERGLIFRDEDNRPVVNGRLSADRVQDWWDLPANQTNKDDMLDHALSGGLCGI